MTGDGRARLARAVVASLGGRYSTELGIDVDAGEDEVERWFVAATYDGRVGAISDGARGYPGLRAALDALPGWGPATVGLFLRELRGVWPGADPPLDARAARAAHHLGLAGPDDAGRALRQVRRVARSAGLDVRDLESGLVRLTLAHGAAMEQCPGGGGCSILAR